MTTNDDGWRPFAGWRDDSFLDSNRFPPLTPRLRTERIAFTDQNETAKGT